MESPDAHGNDVIRVHVEGAHADGGVGIVALAGFLRHFVTALRAHDQILSGRPVRQSGHPTHRDEIVSGFRVVGVDPNGSSAILLRPDSDAETDELRLEVEAERLSSSNLEALMRAIADRQPLADPIVAALD